MYFLLSSAPLVANLIASSFIGSGIFCFVCFEFFALSGFGFNSFRVKFKSFGALRKFCSSAARKKRFRKSFVQKQKSHNKSLQHRALRALDSF